MERKDVSKTEEISKVEDVVEVDLNGIEELEEMITPGSTCGTVSCN